MLERELDKIDDLRRSKELTAADDKTGLGRTPARAGGLTRSSAGLGRPGRRYHRW